MNGNEWNDMDVPNPGSDEAVAAGCTCPVMDNGRGDPEIGRIRGFYCMVDCPVHGSLAIKQREEA